MPLGVLCGVMQELCQCLSPLLEGDGYLSLEMLDVAEEDPMAPAPASAPASPTPEPEEEEQVLQVPEEPCISESEEASHLERRLDLILGRVPINITGICPLAGGPNPSRFGKGYTTYFYIQICAYFVSQAECIFIFI